MTYRFIIISSESEDFMREIEIDSNAKFLELHEAIQETCGYEPGQVTSFVMCRKGWERGEEVALEDMGFESSKDSYVMAKTRLKDLLTKEKQHMLYVFDPLSERAFFIELSEIIPSEEKKIKTKVTREQGKAPKQIAEPVFDENFEDDDLFGDGIDDEDIELEGLDISDSLEF